MTFTDDTQLIFEVLRALKEQGLPYETFNPASDVSQKVQGLLESYPIAKWGRIDWVTVKDHICLEWSDTDDLVNAFRGLVQRTNISEQQLVSLLWTHQKRPCIRTTLLSVENCAAEVFETDWDTWIIAVDGKWCFEAYHEGELCFGRKTA